VIRRWQEQHITPHSRIGLTPSVADVDSRKLLLRQLPSGVRECEKRYLKPGQVLHMREDSKMRGRHFGILSISFFYNKGTDMKMNKLFNETPGFETPRLILRRLKLEDAPDYFEFASNPLATKYTWWENHKTLEDSVNYIQQVINKYNSRNAYHWGIIYKDTNKIIGRTGIVSIDEVHKRLEIGFALSYDYWNFGIMTEATMPVIQYVFDVLEFNRIEARCNFENLASEKVLKKLGMKFEGILREQLIVKGIFTDQKMYSILRREFEGNF